MTFTNDPPLISDLSLIPGTDEKADLNAPAGSGGKLVIGQAPNITITETNVVADAAERLALDVQEGDIAIQTNTSQSFIFTGGPNLAPNWQVIDFDAVGAIDGEAISPSDITADSYNGADATAAAAGEAITSDGSGGLSFASIGGIDTVSTFGDLPNIDPPQIAFVEQGSQYYVSREGVGAFDLQNASFDGRTFDINETDQPKDIELSVDGAHMYTIDVRNNEAYQYSLSTPFDLSTATYTGKTLSTQDPASNGLSVSTDGTVFIELGENTDTFYQYSMSTPFDLDTATFDNVTLPTQDTLAGSMDISPDGTHMYEVGFDSDKFYQYSLSSPFDISTATFTGKTLNTQDDIPKGMVISDNGLFLYEVGFSNKEFRRYTLGTPFDISTATLDFGSLSTQDFDPNGIALSPDGSVMFESGRNNERVYSYTLPLTNVWEEITT